MTSEVRAVRELGRRCFLGNFVYPAAMVACLGALERGTVPVALLPAVVTFSLARLVLCLAARNVESAGVRSWWWKFRLADLPIAATWAIFSAFVLDETGLEGPGLLVVVVCSVFAVGSKTAHVPDPIAVSVFPLTLYLPTAWRVVREPSTQWILVVLMIAFVGYLFIQGRTMHAEYRDRLEAEDLLLRASEAKGAFLATMSHELRTPLNGIVGSMDLLQMTRLSGEQRDLAETARHCARSLSAIVDDVLDFSKVESGTIAIRSAPFDLRAEAEAAIDVIVLRLDASRIRVELDVAGDLPQRVLGDADRYRQILLNLLANAVKYTESGTVRVEVETRRSPAGFKVETRVRDDGIGLREEDLERIFDPFTQVDDSDPRRSGGVGLGLAICRKLCKRMGGTIEAVVPADGGAEFRFRLPLPPVDAPLPEPAEAPASRIPVSEPRVLVVEDNPVNRAVAARLLKKLGCRVDVTEDGLEALDALDERSYDLVFLDCQMPRLDGYETARRIRARPGARPVVVGLTARTMGGDRERCLAAGMDDFVAKPVGLAGLQEALDRHLGASSRATRAS